MITTENHTKTITTDYGVEQKKKKKKKRRRMRTTIRLANVREPFEHEMFENRNVINPVLPRFGWKKNFIETTATVGGAREL
jgi:hypothetical protein